MSPHEDLIKWAKEREVEINGIEPRPIPGRGIGVVATRDLEAGETILEIPVALLRTRDTVPKAVARRLPKGLTVHGLLAADLALDRSTKHALWNAVMPTREDMTSSMPLFWDAALQAHLPKPAADIVVKQRAKLAKDWAAVSGAFAALDRGAYEYAWALVNTRTFYYTTPRTERLALPRDDKMALQPVADLLNHADAGCGVAYSAGGGYAVTADRAYAAGEEVFISYGAYGNDFLLAEYGFVLADGRNRWDECSLDDVVLPELGERHRRALEERGYLGKYVLDAEQVCYRTQVALRAVALPRQRWLRFLDGHDEDEAEREKADELLGRLLRTYEKRIRGTIREIRSLDAGQESQRETLAMRWRQIEVLVSSAINRLAS